MSYQHQRSSVSLVPFPTRNTSCTFQTQSVEARRPPPPTPQAQWIHKPLILSAYALVPGSDTQYSPRTPLRTGTAGSTDTSPSIDAIRALYRKYPDRFPRTPPQAGTMLPNAPGGTVPSRYRNTIRSASPDSPTPDRPRSTISHAGCSSRRNAIPASLTRDPRRKQPADAAVDTSELTLMYPDFDQVLVSAEDPAPNLALEIVSQPRDIEKWESLQRDMYGAWKGNGWKLRLVISYLSSSAFGHIDLDFEPSIAVKNVTVDCSLAAKPRLISGTTISSRRPSESYRVTYSGFPTTFNSRGKLESMQVDRGIHMDRDWRGPILATAKRTGKFERRMEYRANIYIPIPSLLFSAADTRAFDIDVSAWVSIANRSAVQLKRSERITLSQFGQVSGHDDSVGCVLTR